LGLGSAYPVLAQTAADKATARQLATQGIQSYQQGKNAEALELLQKAEQLYDAPIHLVYIARAQAALGKLVEASETYRRLVRIDLPAGAPQAFKDAISDAHKELPQLEPRIPSLRIDVNPSEAEGLKLKIDGEQLSNEPRKTPR
jgi:tetratricopeptide (TPR) repeat protein